MFGLLKAKNTYEEKARSVYAVMLERVREQVFYTEYGVPDTFDGRFDLLVIHASLVMESLVEQGDEGQQFNQALFDVMFADMDQALRQMGAGDMSVPKHMRRMMKGFNGRVQAYAEAETSKELQEALIRNLYGTVKDPEAGYVNMIIEYIQSCRESIRRQQIMSGTISFVSFQERKAA